MNGLKLALTLLVLVGGCLPYPGSMLMMGATHRARRPLDTGDTSKPVVAVFDLVAYRVDIGVEARRAFGDSLATFLTASGRYQTVPRDDLRKRLRMKKHDSYRGCYDRACQIEIGREVAATKTLATQVTRVGSLCIVDAKLYDLRRATTQDAAYAEGNCDENSIMTSIKVVAAKLCGTGRSVFQRTAPLYRVRPALSYRYGYRHSYRYRRWYRYRYW